VIPLALTAVHVQDRTAFVTQAQRDDGIFGDHLRRILILLAGNAALSEVVRGVLRGKPCPSAETFYRLCSESVECPREMRKGLA
jgi:hypothetical protein